MRLEEALPLIEAAFSHGASFRFYPRGTSMLPMLRQGIDSVSIVSPSVREPKVLDVILYRRANGAIVLHRAVKKDGEGAFVCSGDNQTVLEYGVSRESIIGVLDGYFKDDKWISADDAAYQRYVKKRVRGLWLRRLKTYLRNVII